MNGGGIIESFVDLGEAGVTIVVQTGDFCNENQDLQEAVKEFEDNLNTFLPEPYSITIEDVMGDACALKLELA